MVRKLLIAVLAVLFFWLIYFHGFLNHEKSEDEYCRFVYNNSMIEYPTVIFPDEFSPEKCERAKFFVYNTPNYLYWLIPLICVLLIIGMLIRII